MFIRLLLIASLCLSVSFAQEEEEGELLADTASVDSPFLPEYRMLGQQELKNAKTYYSLQEALANPKEVYKLSLKGQSLKELPDALQSLTNLQWLDLSNNRLKELPDWFSRLNRIEMLNLYDNRLTSLPDNLSALTHLHTLYVGSNRLTEIPVWMGGIGKLRKLDVSNNGLTLYELNRLASMLPDCDITH